jgi:phosphate-selective porin OprO/OprP
MNPRIAYPFRLVAACFGFLVLTFSFSEPNGLAEESPNEPGGWGSEVKQIQERLKEGGHGIFGNHFYWDDGLHIEGRYRKLKFSMGGSIMVDGGTVTANNDLEEAFPGLGGSSVDLRMLRLNGRALVGGFLELELDVDFANIRQVKGNWFRFPKIPVLRDIKFGYMKEPFSLEELTSLKDVTFVERALPVASFSPGRSVGVRYNTPLFNNRMTLGAGAFWNTSSYSSAGELVSSFSNSNGYDITARITGLPRYSEDGKELLHLGLCYSHGVRDTASQVAFKTNPESRLPGDDFVDTGEFEAGSLDRIDAEVAVVRGPLSFQMEYFRAFTHETESGNPGFWGAYVFGSYFLTGESRAYDPTSAAFKAINPEHGIFSKGGWGAWELGLRLSYVDLNDQGIQGGTEGNVTVGLNWYLSRQLRFMFNYIYANVDDRESPYVTDGHADIFQTRFQWSF